MSGVRVRLPPSPTGYCHVGTARMAILNYLFAKRHGGIILFRSEDTDKARSKREFEDDIIDQLHWLGITWDEFYRTTELVETHTKALQKLIAEDKAYISKEESKKEPGKMIEVVRLRNPGRSVTFTDEIRGDITFDSTELGDFTIARAIDDPIYHFAVVVDDGEMGITHVIRGEDHISNTPRQILIQEALGYPRPKYAHYPLHLSADRSKLSKRTGDVAVRNYREKGYLSESLLNYIAHLGWTPPSGREIMGMQEMIDEFELSDLHKSGAVFDVEKLRWFNRQYLLKLDDALLESEAVAILKDELSKKGIEWQDNIGLAVVRILKERISVWQDLRDFAQEGEIDFFFSDPSLETSKIPDKKSSASETAAHLSKSLELLKTVSDWTPESIKASLWDYASEAGRAQVLWPLRYCLTGREKSPDPFVVAFILGKETVMRRVLTTIELLKKI